MPCPAESVNLKVAVDAKKNLSLNIFWGLEVLVRRDGWITSVCRWVSQTCQNVIGCFYIQVFILSLICSLPNVTHKLLLARSLDFVLFCSCFVWRILSNTLYNLGISVFFFLVCWGFSGLDCLGGWLAGLLLAAFLGAVIWGPVQDAPGGLQCLEVLPGAQQGWIVDQRVQQLPARVNPLTTGRLARPIFLNP